MKICLRLMYDGSDYSGFQKQENAKTVQGTVEDIISEINGYRIETIGASRTDSGVHSIDNLLIFNTDKEYPEQKWRDILNAYLPYDIRIKDSYRAADDFHPLSCKSIKTYKYTINNADVYDPIHYKTSWHIKGELDISKMLDTAKIFIGFHDFKLFKNGNKEYKTTYRNIYTSKIIKDNKFITYLISADGFMYNMVRKIVGCIVEVGMNKTDIITVKKALENPNNSNYTSFTAPAKGLMLYSVDYKQKERYFE